MALFNVFLLLALASTGLSAPSTKNGKPAIDRGCTFSPVLSADALQCAKVTPVQEEITTQDEEPILFEGDIAGILAPGDTIADLDAKLNGLTKAAILSTNQRWWGGYVYYHIASTFTAAEQNTIKNAMNEFATKTDAVRFHPRGTSNDYINIVKGSGCHSMVGKQGGAQTLSLGNGCVHHGTIVHELNHAVGFWHEQSRSDRDTYVEINWDNIPQSNRHNFNKYAASSTTTSGTGYDFASLMHYDKFAFAQNHNTWTIRPKAPWQNSVIGKGTGLSTTDIKEINAIYKLCATMWHEPNYTGRSIMFVAGQSANFHADDQDKMSSAKVTLGCTLTTYGSVNQQGTATVFKPTQAGVLWYNFAGKTYDNDARSVKCVCA